MYSIPNVCFMCFSKDNLKRVFHDDKDSIIATQMKFVLPEITNLKLKAILHYYMCSTCCSSLDSAYAFKKTWVKRYNVFNTYINILQTPAVISDHRLIKSQKQTENKQKAAHKEDVMLNIDETEDNLIESEDISERFETSEVEENVNGDIVDYESETNCMQDGSENEDQIGNNEQGTGSKCTSDVANEEINEQLLDRESETSDNDGGEEQEHASDLKYKCTICNKTFVNKSQLIDHLQKHAGIREFTCDICHKKFVTKGLLQNHMSVHIGLEKYTCAICDKKFRNKFVLREHIKSHSKIREFKCTICDKSFVFKYGLVCHLKIHAGIKKYKCRVCDKDFITNADLNKHTQIHSKNCAICDVQFESRYAVLNHMKEHFKCTICTKQFASKTRLMWHLKRHAGIAEVPMKYKCDICGNKYRRKIDLVHHEKNHAGIKDHVCPFCNKGFVWKTALNVHIRRKHPEKL